MCRKLKRITAFLVFLLGHSPSLAAEEKESQWEGTLELNAAPTVGIPLNSSSTADPIDEMEFEAAIRFRRTIDEIGGLRLQFKAGVTSSPNFVDNDAAESSYYGEIQIGDTYMPFSALRQGRFGTSAGPVRVNAVRPYGRYRISSVHDDFIEAYQRTDHRAILGLRYRRVTGNQPDPDDSSKNIPKFYLEVRGEVGRVWSSLDSEEHWNPRFQVDLYSPTFFNRTRFVVRATAEASIFDNAVAPSGEKRSDKRIRISTGFDLSDSIKDWLDWQDRSVTIELLGRFQKRWSNDPSKEHTRGYFVPTIAVSLPLQ